MSLKFFIIFTTLLAITYADYGSIFKSSSPTNGYTAKKSPKYEFSYSVHDEHTGDIKDQYESRNGDSVHGTYSLIDSDGYKRIVEYSSDKHNGFNAKVSRIPTHYKIPIPAVNKIVSIPFTKSYAKSSGKSHHLSFSSPSAKYSF